MSRLLLLLLLVLGMAVSATAQQRKTTGQRKATSAQSAVRRKSAPATGQTGQKSAQKTARRPGQKTAAKRGGAAAGKAKAQQQPSVKGLQNERKKLKEEMVAQEARLRQNERNVKQRLQNLMVINNEIDGKRKTIDTIRRDISVLDGDIVRLTCQLDTLQRQLNDRKQRYRKSMRFMHRNRSIENKLMFVFSAQNFTQMFRRQRFTREYAAYQRVQGEAVKAKREEVSRKNDELKATKSRKGALLSKGVEEQRQLETRQVEQQQMVSSLQKEQKTIQGIIAEQRRKDAELNARIDKLIAEEIARAKARAEAEAKRKAAEEQARKRAEELARKKAAAEAAARENARRLAEAKAKEDRLKAEARAAARTRKSAQERAAAERAARRAEMDRKAIERKSRTDARAHELELAEARRNASGAYTMPAEDRRLSGSLEANRGRLPMPITGPYKIVSHFGQYAVEGLKSVTLDNKGIHIRGQSGARVRSVFDGEVSAVTEINGTKVVLVRHGNYISVYCNLAAVNVRIGQKVSTRQVLGTLTNDNILQFQLRRETAKLNPEKWLGR